MNERERIELLKQVAECAPKEWASPHGIDTWDRGVLRFDVPNEPGSVSCYLRLMNDIHDAEAIIAMLDAMEQNGDYVSVYRVSGNQYYCSTSANDRVMTKGATRAEAAAKAFVQVFGGKQS
jgi:hypothetical protein